MTPAGRLDKALCGEARAVQAKIVDALEPHEVDLLAVAIAHAAVRREELAKALTQERFGSGSSRG